MADASQPVKKSANKAKEVEDYPDDHLAAGDETILLVDDEQVIIDVARDMLEILGYQVIVSQSGQDAIDIFTQQKDEIDLVILDMVMPGMGGGAAFDALRAINPAVKIILSSGYSVDGVARTILDRGCNGFIQKPFLLAELSRKIREIL